MGIERDWVRGGLIGAGAFGTVSLAINKSNGELFAVKSMRAELSPVVESEYNILRSLDSPYVVRCLGKDCTVENGVEVCNLWMEYVPGGSVGDLVANFGGRLDESLIRAYTRCILLGIQYLHGQGIVHCDIKGKNVLVGSGGVKLADFGSARRKEDKGWSVRELRGTPLWMAPEVVNQVEQGPPSDIWSLGCTVLEMATGRPPWGDVSNALAAMYRIGCTDELPELPQCLSPQGRDFLEKCFRRDPQQRWTAAQLLSHPFLKEATEVKRAPLSPTSALDLGHPDWDSCSLTVPILSLDISRASGKPETEEERKPANRYCSPRPSPRDRMLALAAGGPKPDWTEGQWIVVRSSNPPLPNSNICSPVEKEDNSTVENSDLEKSQSTEGSPSAEASAEQSQPNFEPPTISPLIVDESQEVCSYSLEDNSGYHSYVDAHNRAVVGKIVCAEHICRRSFTRGQEDINVKAEMLICNLISILIQILLLWLQIWFLFGLEVQYCVIPEGFFRNPCFPCVFI